jgi:uncharacterized protein
MSITARQFTEVSAGARRNSSLLARLVALCAARPLIVAVAAMILCAATTRYVVDRFAMTTDTDALLSHELPWRKRQKAFDAAFPQNGSDLVVVVDGKTPELSEQAAARLTARLRARTSLFHSVDQPDAGPFWAHNALLFASTGEVQQIVGQLVKVQPFLGSMAQDPSLRGLANTLSLAVKGVNGDRAEPDQLRAPIRALGRALEHLRGDKPAFFSWRDLITGKTPDERQLRRILLVDPVLDYARLEPGALPIDVIGATARRLHLDEAHGVRVRVTGPVALQDDEFATLTEGAGWIACLAGCAIVLMLWFAVRSPWLIASILVTMLIGLVAATAIGLALFHRFNVISVAFIPLFVGMGMDLGIQFSVRYRAEHCARADVHAALIAAGESMGRSLALAAAAIGLGFLAFAPTSYHGVSQLGVIAGVGIFAALALNLTLLPALIALTRAPGARVRPPHEWLTKVDEYVPAHKRLVVALGAAAALACAALLPWLHFDFNPMHLKNPNAQSVATLLDLMKDPDRSPNTLEVIRPSLAAADRLARTFRADPNVYRARTLSSFIPTHQSEKLALLGDAANLLDLTSNPIAVAPPPTDAELIESLRHAATQLGHVRTEDASFRADAKRLADEFDQLARGSASARARAAQMLIPGFLTTLHNIGDLLHPRRVSIDTLPRELARQWETHDGRARVSVLPEGDSNSDTVLHRFVAAGVKIAPDATGTAIYIQTYARAVVDAFIEAGALSFVIICGLLLLTLHRVRDVAITMAPIVLTGLLTMGTCVLIGQPLNYANIIALPLLFGIGVAFHIYFVLSWRSGGSHLLTSSLARGVFFSALATATGFGSLWASKDPGTASMGKLLMISLIWTLASALLFQPALIAMGCTRSKAPPTTS